MLSAPGQNLHPEKFLASTSPPYGQSYTSSTHAISSSKNKSSAQDTYRSDHPERWNDKGQLK